MWHSILPQGAFFVYIKRVEIPHSTLCIFSMDFVDLNYEEEAIAALMEEALTETKEDTKFDVENYIKNSTLDY